MRPRENAADYGLERPPEDDGQPQAEVQRSEARAGQFVHRIYRLVPLTELEQDAYSPGGPRSGQKMPKFREELVSERFFEGIG
jgi:hypothetical protein